MGKYKILIKSSAIKEIEAIPFQTDRQRIIGRIQTLAGNPRPPGCEKLSGHDDKYRVRQGRYRIVYSIEDLQLVVYVVKVGHRKDVYR